jgi:hypothetical protein
LDRFAVAGQKTQPLSMYPEAHPDLSCQAGAARSNNPMAGSAGPRRGARSLQDVGELPDRGAVDRHCLDVRLAGPVDPPPIRSKPFVRFHAGYMLLKAADDGVRVELPGSRGEGEELRGSEILPQNSIADVFDTLHPVGQQQLLLVAVHEVPRVHPIVEQRIDGKRLRGRVDNAEVAIVPRPESHEHGTCVLCMDCAPEEAHAREGQSETAFDDSRHTGGGLPRRVSIRGRYPEGLWIPPYRVRGRLINSGMTIYWIAGAAAGVLT